MKIGAANPTYTGNQLGCAPGSCTHYNTVGAVGEQMTSPIDGVIVRWRAYIQSGNGLVRLRVLHRDGANSVTGVRGDSSLVSASGQMDVATRLKISAGDTIGLNVEQADVPYSPLIAVKAQPGAFRRVYLPQIADGATVAENGPTAGEELMYNADVEPDVDCDGYGDESQDDGIGPPCPKPNPGGASGATSPPPPPNSFTTGKLSRNKKKGTATLSITVPADGELTTGGKDVSASRVVKQGTVKVTIKAKGKAKKKLRRKGSVKLNVKITFKPTGGVANTQTKTVKLVKRN